MTTKTPRQLVVLLRGINVGGNRKVPMAELRKLATDLGLAGVRTYIASGNLLVRTAEPIDAVHDALAEAIAAHFGFQVDLVLREADAVRALAAGGVFPDAERDRPRHLHVGFARQPAAPGAAETLAQVAGDDERIEVVGDAVWIDYATGAGRSKITPARLDRAFGTPVTCRNFRTLQKLTELLDAARDQVP